MSYEVIFLPKNDDQSWDEALEKCEEAASTPLDENRRAVYLRIAEQAGSLFLRPEIGSTDEHVELVDEETGVQLHLSTSEVTLAVPYWLDGEKAERVLERLRDIARIVERETGWRGYDTQQGAEFLDDENSAGPRRTMDQISEFLDSIEGGESEEEVRRGPWWKFW